MNKKLSRIKNSILAFVLSLGMILGLIPGTVSYADGTTGTNRMEVVASVTGYSVESGYTDWYATNTEPDNTQYSCNNNGKLRLRGNLSDYTYRAGDVLEINYTTALSGTEVLLCKDTSSNYIKLGTIENDKEKATFVLPETSIFTGDIQPLYVRFKNNNCQSGNTLGFYGISILRESENGTPDPTPQPEEPSESESPVFEAVLSDGCNYEVNGDGGWNVDYKKGSWNRLDFSVTGSDVSKYEKLVIDLTPPDDIVLGVYVVTAAGDKKLRDHWAKERLSAERQTLEYDLTEDITGLYFWIDPNVWGDNLPEGYVLGENRQLVFNDIKLVGNSSTEEPEEPTGDPSVKVNVSETSSGYAASVNGEEVTFTYNNVSGDGWWHTVKLGITDCDITKANQLRIDITPAGDDMTIGVYDGTENICFRSHSTLPKSGRQVLKVDLTDNVDKIKLFCDATLGALGERSFTIHKVWLCDKDDPDFILSDKVKFTTIDGERYTTLTDVSEGGFGTVEYVTGQQPRIFGRFEGIGGEYAYSSNDVFAFEYEGIDDIKSAFSQVLIGYGLSGGEYITLNNPAVKGSYAYFTLPEDTSGYFSEKKPVYVRFKMNVAAEDTVLKFKGMHIYDAGQFEEYLKTIEEPVVTGHFAKINKAASSGYRFTDNADGSITVKYQREAKANWSHINVDIVNDDYDTYDQLRIELIPANAMTMAILADKNDANGNNIWYRSHTDFDSDDKQILKINLKKDNKSQTVEMPVTGLYLYCDSEEAHNVSLVGDAGTLDREFVINRIWICNSQDPDFMPTEKALFTNVRGNYCDVADVKGGGYAKVTSKGSEKDGKIRLYGEFTYNEGFSYNPGDVFALKWDGLDYETIKEFETIIGYEDGSAGHIAFSAAKKAGDYVYYDIPEDKDGKFAATAPKYVRFKANVGPDGSVSELQGMHIYDGAEWKKFINSFTYNEEDCPQGVAVSYYDGIYSRGFAWATYAHIDNEQILQYVKADASASKDDVNWDSADVITVPAVKGTDRTDVSGAVWHMYKVHIENLEPGSFWYFRVGNKDTGFCDTGSFKIEEAETDKLTFLHLTDCQEGNQSGYTRWAKVLECGYKMFPDSSFVAFTGDLTNDSHAHLNMMQWNWGLGEPKKNLLNTVIMPSAGNHDEWPYSFTDRFDIKWADYIKEGDKHPDTGKIITDGTIDEKTGGCYTFEYGDDIVMINLNTNDTNNEIDFTSQYNWLKSQLEKYKDKKWKIVQLHKGLMSTGNHTNDGEVDWLRDILPPLFAEYEVDLVLQGHDHVYTRSRSYFYGTDFDGNYYSGHKPCWLNGVVYDGRDEDHPKYVFQGEERDITNLEPNGTHYETINYCANKSYAVAPYIDKVIYPGVNPVFSMGPDGELTRNGTSIQLQGQPMFGAIQIDGDTLIYDSYVYNTTTKDATLYDTFMVKKGDAENDFEGIWNRGYRDSHEGFEELTIESIMVEDKVYDGKPVELNLHGFVTNDPSFIDYSKLTFHTVGTTTYGKPFDSKEKLPIERGNYKLIVSADVIVETDGDPVMYYLEKEIYFSIK